METPSPPLNVEQTTPPETELDPQPPQPFSVILPPEQHSKDTVPVTEADFPDLSAVIETMKKVIADKRGIGLAGPQVGYNKRIFVVRESHPTDSNTDPWDVCINPTLIPHPELGKVAGEEGCLTFPGELFTVSRWHAVSLEWFTPIFSEDGKTVIQLSRVKNDVAGGWARVAQHEYDHLFGKLVSETGTKLDQTQYLKDAATLAGLTFDEATGQVLRKDPATGQMVAVDRDRALAEVVDAVQASRIRSLVKTDRKERKLEKDRNRREILRRRKKEKENRKKARRR